MKKKIITAFAIAAFVMGGTLISPNSSDNTLKANEREMIEPGTDFNCDYISDKQGCPNPGHGCSCD